MYQSNFLVGLVLLASSYFAILLKCQLLGAGDARRQKRDTLESEDNTVENRIAHGRVSELYEFPWAVRLASYLQIPNRKGTVHYGAGTLISSKYVLTAAHCIEVENGTVTRVEVYIAEYDMRTFPKDCVDSSRQKCIYNVKMVAAERIIHPYYRRVPLVNDIALLRLSKIVRHTAFSRPICMPLIDIHRLNISNVEFTAVGWGLNVNKRTNVLMATELNLVFHKECAKTYRGLSKMYFCAIGSNGKDTCEGDSGGPIMLKVEGHFYLAGIIVGSLNLCSNNEPGLYLNVYYYMDWIMTYLGEDYP